MALFLKHIRNFWLDSHVYTQVVPLQVDVHLDYNLLLGRNWTYVMVGVVSFIFRTLCFPHEGKIMTINQLSFAYASPNASVGPLIPVIDNS
jgi:hypothetical protein